MKRLLAKLEIELAALDLVMSDYLEQRRDLTMMKTLEEAIGCWTTSPNGLLYVEGLVKDSVRSCARVTRIGDSRRLQKELALLRTRLETMECLTMVAQTRIKEIIDTNECPY